MGDGAARKPLQNYNFLAECGIKGGDYSRPYCFSGKAHGWESPLESIANELIEPTSNLFPHQDFFAVLRFLRVGNSLGIPK